MPVTSVSKDPEALTLTVVADVSAPLERLWQAYADARIIERFWGPPTYPASFTRHDMEPGGRSQYTMTGPEGDTHGGYWEFLAVDPPHSFEVLDGFSHPDGSPNTDMPITRAVFSFEETDDGSRVTVTSYFDTAAELAQLSEMGMEEGLREAMSQIDDVLADVTA